jgi:transglutaminase-like putative cysteine protease
MTLERNFKISSSFLLASGFASIAATGNFHWLPVALFAIALAFSLFGDATRVRKRLPVWVLNSFLVVFILFFALEVALHPRVYVVALVHFTFLIASVRLLTISKDRDYVFLYLTSFVLLLATSVFTANPAFLIFYLIFLVSGVHTFILFEMRRSSAAVRDSAREHPSTACRDSSESSPGSRAPFPNRLLFAVSLATALFVLGLAVPLFLILPRSAAGFQIQPSADSRLVSGFSGKVELGRAGKLEPSDAVVMRVRTSRSADQLPVDLKWRGMAFDRYDGRSWSRSDRLRYPVPVREGHFKLEDSAIGTDWLTQTFYLEALSTDVVFAARKALAISKDVGLLSRDSVETLYGYPHWQGTMRYVAISDLSPPNPAFFSDSEPIPPDIGKVYLQLPAVDSRIKKLAQQVTDSIAGRYEKVKALEQYLRTHYAYSLDLKGTPESEDPVAMFLFETRSGHCEYFASAMAIMLRYIGIPSRIVNGFRAGDYNPIGDSWTVRQNHAHSWTEAYLPPYGWLGFDPTPVQHADSRGGFARLWTDFTDAVDLWWREHVVHYDASRRNTLVAAIYSALGNMRASLNDLVDLIGRKDRAASSAVPPPEDSLSFGRMWYLAIPVIIMIVFFIGPARKKILKEVRPLRYRNKPFLYATAFYHEALEMLAKRGIIRAPGQTPAELVRSLANHPAADPLDELTRRYNDIRFGPARTVPNYKEVESLLKSLRLSLNPISRKF